MSKFYTFVQTNTHGRYIESESAGVGNFVIIEANNYDELLLKFKSISEKFDNDDEFFDNCSCCGYRWSIPIEEFFKSSPSEPRIFDKKLSVYTAAFEKEICYVHRLNGEVEKHEFKK